MICLDCGISVIECTGDLTLHSRTIGDFIVSNVTYRECPKCGEQFFSPETLDFIEATEKDIKELRIAQYPIADFIGADEAAEILECTRQALHHNRRVRRGFIYSLRFGGKIAYLKKSVELFKETGDGRFELGYPYLTEQPEYTKETNTQQFKPDSIKPIDIYLGEHLVWGKGVETILHGSDSFFVQEQSGNLTVH